MNTLYNGDDLKNLREYIKDPLAMVPVESRVRSPTVREGAVCGEGALTNVRATDTAAAVHTSSCMVAKGDGY